MTFKAVLGLLKIFLNILICYLKEKLHLSMYCPIKNRSV